MKKKGLIGLGGVDGRVGDNETETAIMKEWLKLREGVISDIKNHNENFMENETTGYLDEKGRWIEPKDFGGERNRGRFLSVAKDAKVTVDEYVEEMKIEPAWVMEALEPEMVNALSRVTNFFIKAVGGEGDQANA